MVVTHLTNILDLEIEKYKSRILADIKKFISSGDKYWNRSYSDCLQIILRMEGNEQLKTIGFPFPLVSYPLELDNIQDISINICLRGKPLRDFQRSKLVEELKQKVNVLFIEVDDISDFRKLTKQLCIKYKECNYFDPYSFIGDSFIGLHLVENFVEQFNLKLRSIYSENYLNLNIVANAKGYVEASTVDKKNLAIFSDLVDTHWDRTKHLVKNLALKGIASIIVGRNLLISPEDKNIKIYHYTGEDPLLKKENIEDYMN